MDYMADIDFFKQPQNFKYTCKHICGVGQGGEPWSNEGRKSTGGERREGGRRDIQGGRNREKQKINFATLHIFLQ